MKNIKPLIFITALILSAAILITVVAFHNSATSVDDFETVATVNGYEICAKELSQRMSVNKPYVIEKYIDYTIDDEFWETEINGEKPIDVLRNMSFEQLVRYKIEQEIAVKNGILEKEHTDYQSFLTSLENENIDRSQKIARGEVVYGAKSYNESTYFTYIHSNMQIDNREALGEKGNDLYANEKTLKKWYESVKEEKYPKADTYEFDYYYASFDLENNPQESMEKARKIIENVKLSLESDDAEYIKKNKGELFEYKTLHIDDETASDVQKTMPQFFDELDSLEKGDISSVFSENGNCYVVVCKSRQKGGYKDFDEYKTAMYSEYIAEKYEIYVDSLVKSAKIEKYEKFQFVK